MHLLVCCLNYKMHGATVNICGQNSIFIEMWEEEEEEEEEKVEEEEGKEEEEEEEEEEEG